MTFHVTRGAIAGWFLPGEFPLCPTLYQWFYLRQSERLVAPISQALAFAGDECAAQPPNPSSAIIDGQNATAAANKGLHGDDAGRALMRRNRSVLADADAPVFAPCHSLLGHRDGTAPLLSVPRRLFPINERILAATAYPGTAITAATRICVDTAKALFAQFGFAILPCRSIPDQLFAATGRSKLAAIMTPGASTATFPIPLRLRPSPEMLVACQP